MTDRGQSERRDLLERLVTIPCLGSAADTRAARHFRELGCPPPADDVLDRVAARVGIPIESRSHEIERARGLARRACAAAETSGLAALTVRDPGYPELLRQIVDPPPVLWLKGDPASLIAPAVAIVGARAATPAGLNVARRLGHDLAGAGLVVVSGLARGADAAAHAGALDAGGRTVAVLGCGADVVYPPEHAELARRIAAHGAVASELWAGAPPLAHHFPLRNRIISGLVRAVVVVEASEKSGSLITARCALEQGREVLAVPGSVASGRYRGSHALIKDGARLVETVEDVLDELGWPIAGPQASDGPRQSTGQESSNSLQESELEMAMAPGEPYTVDELAEQSGRPAATLLAELGALELSGRVSRIAGGAFVRLDEPARYRRKDTARRGGGAPRH